MGPLTLNLRKDLGTGSSVVASARHGDKLDVIETRRRFVRVRTAAGLEGWTDFNLLLSEQQMNDLRRLAASAKQLPSQGAATVYESLNIHAEPFRQSPSFFQIPEGGKVDVIGHRLAPRNPPPAPKPPPLRRSASARKAKAPAKPNANAFLLPLPAPPPPPSNLEQLSRPHAAHEDDKPPLAGAPAALDDWNLVRTPGGDVGWALARMLIMAIPDEVAQYAEGHRITAYLALGEVLDRERNETKPNWLWTTLTGAHAPYEFDSFRVFVWSTRRHRYETAYIERNVKGYYPVETVSLPGQGEKAFSLVLEDKDGGLYKRTYGFSGYHVRMISRVPFQPAPPLPEVRASAGFESAPPPSPPAVTLGGRLREWRQKWLGR